MTSQEDDFWVVLPSNSNMQTHLSNQPNDYTVRLRRPVELSQNDWEVAILSVQYPYNWYNFRSDLPIWFVLETEAQVQVQLASSSAIVGLKVPTDVQLPTSMLDVVVKVVKVVLPRANYGSVDELCTKLCSLFDDAYKAQGVRLAYKYDVETYRCTFTVSLGELAMLGETVQLGSILGLQSRTGDTSHLGDGAPTSMHNFALTGARSARLPRIESIYVYTDIAKHQAVGDTEAPLLGIIPVKGNFGERCYWSFNPPIYMGLNKTRIDEVRVMLRSETGDLIPFPKDSPSVICSLRFRRRKNAI